MLIPSCRRRGNTGEEEDAVFVRPRPGHFLSLLYGRIYVFSVYLENMESHPCKYSAALQGVLPQAEEDCQRRPRRGVWAKARQSLWKTSPSKGGLIQEGLPAPSNYPESESKVLPNEDHQVKVKGSWRVQVVAAIAFCIQDVSRGC